MEKLSFFSSFFSSFRSSLRTATLPMLNRNPTTTKKRPKTTTAKRSSTLKSRMPCASRPSSSVSKSLPVVGAAVRNNEAAEEAPHLSLSLT